MRRLYKRRWPSPLEEVFATPGRVKAVMALYQRGPLPTRELAKAVELSESATRRVVAVLLRYGIIDADKRGAHSAVSPFEKPGGGADG